MKDGSQMERAGSDETTTLGFASSRLGIVLVGTTSKGVRFVKIGDDAASRQRDQSFDVAGAATADDERATRIARSVAKLIDDPGTIDSFDAPLDIRGTPFQKTVWQALRQIPPGSTLTYAALAAKIGRRSAVRAVARACATNELAVIIPCHRVVRGDGSLAGYRWGIERKRALLERERRSHSAAGSGPHPF